MKTSRKLTIIALFTVALFSLFPNHGSANSEGKKLLKDLIEKARKEGSLDTAAVTQVGPGVPKLVKAFNKRFGLNLEITTALGDQAGKFAKMLITLRAGGRPEFHTLTGGVNDAIVTVEKGYATQIKNWKPLLAEINPLVASGQAKPDEVSPPVVGGQAFIWGTRTKVMVYHTDLASEKTIPRRIIDLADPKFKGKFTVAPWTDIFEQGLLVYKDKEEWLKVMDRIGKNAAAVMRFQPALNRILLKEYAYTYMNSAEYWGVKARDADAPIGMHWFSDYTPLSPMMFIIPRGSRHPAAGTLWALWMTTPEAQAIVQKASPQENLVFGGSDIDNRSRAAIKKSGSRLVSYLNSPEDLKVLKWWATDEGRKYRSRLKAGITQRR